jgi:tetratricopeptide (TPR) repeat protein
MSSLPSVTVIAATLTAFVGLATALIQYKNLRLSTGMGLQAPIDTNAVKEHLSVGQAFLPSLPYPFVNRRPQLVEVSEKIRAGHPVIALEGDTGIGKSATTMELARLLRDPDAGEVEMPDLREYTFLWVSCEEGCPSPQEICTGLFRLTGDQMLSTAPYSEKLEALRIHMSLRKTVLLMDDLRLSDDENSKAIRRLLDEVPGGSHVIVSFSRHEDLRASRVTLPEMEPEHVAEVIHNQAESLNLELTGSLEESLVRRLQDVANGNPGVVDWVFQSFNQGRGSLADHLASVERGENLQEDFSSSWSALSVRGRSALSACAFLEGGAVVGQVAAACELREDEVGTALEELVDAGLVVPVHRTDRPTAFTCSQRVTRFALLKTPMQTRDRFTARLVIGLKRHFAAHPEDALAAAPYVESLRPVMTCLSEQGNDRDLHALFKAALDILFTLGYFDERISLGLLAYESATAAANHSGASLAAEVLSSTYAARGEIGPAERALALGELAAERSKDPADDARQRRCAGLISFRSKKARQALRQIEDADRIAGEAGDLECVVNVLGVRAPAHRYLGEFDQAEVAARESLRVCEEMPWPRAAAYPLRELAEVSIHRGRFDEARERVGRAAEIASEAGDRRQQARIALTGARLHLLEGSFEKARRHAERAQSEAAGLGLRPEATEARAIYNAAGRARSFRPLGLYYTRRRPRRLTKAPA